MSNARTPPLCWRGDIRPFMQVACVEITTRFRFRCCSLGQTDLKRLYQQHNRSTRSSSAQHNRYIHNSSLSMYYLLCTVGRMPRPLTPICYSHSLFPHRDYRVRVKGASGLRAVGGRDLGRGERKSNCVTIMRELGGGESIPDIPALSFSLCARACAHTQCRPILHVCVVVVACAVSCKGMQRCVQV